MCFACLSGAQRLATVLAELVRQCRTGRLLRTVVSGLGSVTYSNPSPALAWDRGTRNMELLAGEKCFGPTTERTIVRALSDHGMHRNHRGNTRGANAL